jgi:hypothetical protein
MIDIRLSQVTSYLLFNYLIFHLLESTMNTNGQYIMQWFTERLFGAMYVYLYT